MEEEAGRNKDAGRRRLCSRRTETAVPQSSVLRFRFVSINSGFTPSTTYTSTISPGIDIHSSMVRQFTHDLPMSLLYSA